jgi:hypothetical protein
MQLLGKVFEHYLFLDADSPWTDKRQITFFGCIKADLAKVRHWETTDV